jgi:hypothetical protein
MKAALNFVKDYFNNDSKVKGIEQLNSYQTAVKNAAERTIDYAHFTHESTRLGYEQSVLSNLSSRNIKFLGPDGQILSDYSGTTNQSSTAPNELLSKLGVPSMKALSEISNIVGIAKVDQYNTGAGSLIGEVWSPVLQKKIQFVISPDEKQEKIFEASTKLNEPLLNSDKEAYYIVPINNGKLEFLNGVSVSEGTSPEDESQYGPVGGYIKSENKIVDGGTPQAHFEVVYKYMERGKDGKYFENKNIKLSPESLFDMEKNYHSSTVNVNINQYKK